MSERIRARIECTAKDPESGACTFIATETSSDGNQSWSKDAAPTLALSMTINQPEALAGIEVGKFYSFSIKPVET